MTDLSDDEDAFRFSKMPGRSRRRAAIYIPGISDEGSCVQISQSNTPDGPLILGQEVPRRKKLMGDLGLSHCKTHEDIDSGVESSFSLLSLADDSTHHQPDVNRLSVGLNTAHIPLFELPDDLREEYTKDELGADTNSSKETASFLLEAEELLGYSDLSVKSDSIESASCCHGDNSAVCSLCCVDSSVEGDGNSQRPRLLNSEHQLSEMVADEQSQCDEDVQYTPNQPLIKKEILSLPMQFSTSSPLPRGNAQKTVNSSKKKAFEKTFVPASELLFMKPSVPLFTTYKSPSKYSPQTLLSPSAPQKIKVEGEERQCISTQSGPHEEVSEAVVQYLPALDGRMPGTPPKDKVVRSTYLSPVSIDSRTTSEIWQDIVHKSDRKFCDMPLRHGVYTNRSAQTDNSDILSSQPDESHTRSYPLIGNDNQPTVTSREPTEQNEKESTVDVMSTNMYSNGENLVSGEQCMNSRSLTSRKTCVPHRRLFSELPVSPSNCGSVLQNSTVNSPFMGPMTPVQVKKRFKSHDMANGSGDASQPKGRAIRKSALRDSSQSKNGKVRVVRPRKLAAPYETNENRSPSSSFDMEVSPCRDQTSTSYNHGNNSIDVTLDIKTSTPVKRPLRKECPQNQTAGAKTGSCHESATSYFSPLNMSTSSEDNPSPQHSCSRGRKIRPMNLSPGPLMEDRVSSPVPSSSQPMSSPAGSRLTVQTQVELSPPDLDTITKIHTICNGQRLVEYIKCADSPMIITHYPPPKPASKIHWSEALEQEIDSPPPPSPTTTPLPKPILTQRPESFRFPFSDEAPSPILLTKTRRQNILSGMTQHTQL